MPRKLSDEELTEVRKWLSDQNFNLTKLHREFSDGVLVAQLLKKFYPKLIDLHNYPARNNTQLKLINWETLNSKALSKLGIHLNKMTLEKLAKATPGVVETLLCDIMLLEKSTRVKEDNNIDFQEQIWTENDEVMMVTVNKKIGDAIVQVPQKMILYSIYEETLRESSSRDTYLYAAQQKIAHLENILRLKTERIDELCAQLAKLSVRSLLKQHNLENSSPVSVGLASEHIENECSKSIEA